jgi:hypothetical protein
LEIVCQFFYIAELGANKKKTLIIVQEKKFFLKKKENTYHGLPLPINTSTKKGKTREKRGKKGEKKRNNKIIFSFLALGCYLHKGGSLDPTWEIS